MLMVGAAGLVDGYWAKVSIDSYSGPIFKKILSGKNLLIN
jgi:hypothetical protein